MVPATPGKYTFLNHAETSIELVTCAEVSRKGKSERDVGKKVSARGQHTNAPWQRGTGVGG